MEKFYSYKALLKMAGGEGCTPHIPLDPPLITSSGAPRIWQRGGGGTTGSMGSEGANPSRKRIFAVFT